MFVLVLSAAVLALLLDELALRIEYVYEYRPDGLSTSTKLRHAKLDVRFDNPMELAINKLSCGLDGRPDILQAVFSDSSTSGTKRWTKVLNCPNFQWMPNPFGLGHRQRSSTQHMNPRPNKILITRRRWDAYMLPLFLAVAAIGIVRAIQTGQLRFTFLPVVVIPIWLTLRLQTPRDGMSASTVRATPGAIVMLWVAFAALTSMTILLMIDVYIFEHPFRAQLKPYHTLLFAPPFIIMFVGAYFADRIQKEHKLARGVLQDTARKEPSTNNPMNPSGGSDVS